MLYNRDGSEVDQDIIFFRNLLISLCNAHSFCTSDVSHFSNVSTTTSLTHFQGLSRKLMLLYDDWKTVSKTLTESPRWMKECNSVMTYSKLTMLKWRECSQ